MNLKQALFLILLMTTNFVLLSGEVLLDPPLLELTPGDFPKGWFSTEIIVENRDKRPLSISFVTGEDSWQINPGELNLESGERAVLTLEGLLPDEASAPLILLSDREDVPYLYTVSLTGVSSSVQYSGPEKEGEVFVFFHTPGCKVCEEFYNELIPDLIAGGLLESKPEKLNIYDPGNFERMTDLLADRNSQGDLFPLLIRDNQVFRGESSLFKDFPASLEGDFDQGRDNNGDSGIVTAGQDVLSWIPVFMAGLLDGINPCAFTTLIFLISYLRLLGRKGREVLKIGFSFTLAVFISYFLIGLGFFQVVQMAESYSLVSHIIRLGMIGLLLCLGGMSLYDFIRVRQGKENGAVLQLSRGMKQRIHKTIRHKSRSSWLILSSFAAGVLISLYELGCTGQIYLPMIVYMVKQNITLSGISLLLLYNIGFILPLLIVFLLFYKGLDSDTIGRVFNSYLSQIKLASALLFFGIALYLILIF